MYFIFKFTKVNIDMNDAEINPTIKIHFYFMFHKKLLKMIKQFT